MSLPEPYWSSDCGRFTVYCADCLTVLPDLTGVDAVVTDPPYEISAAGGGIGGKRKYLSDIRGHIDCGFTDSLLDGFTNWMVFCAKAQLVKLIARAESNGLRWQIVTWNKTNPTPLTNRNYLPDTEYIVHGFTSHDYEEKARWMVGQVEKNEFDHPTVKPGYVMVGCLRRCSRFGETILDPFMGSGTTGVACIRTGRRFIGVEICEAYCKIAVQRMERELSQPCLPTLEPTAQAKQEVML